MFCAILPLKHILFRFRLAIYIYWALSSAFLGYYVLCFGEANGISVSNIGIMMSLYTLGAIIGQNVFGYICDKLKSIRWPVVIGATLLTLNIISFVVLSEQVILFYLSMTIFGFLQQPLGPMLDSWSLKHLSSHDAENFYGKIRGLGSLGWATSGLFTAYLVKFFGWNMIYVVAASGSVLLGVIALFIPDTKIDSGEVEKSLTPSKAFKKLFTNMEYVYILLVIFFLFLGVQTAYNYLGLIVADAGGLVENLGWTYFIDAGSEIPAMFLSVWLLSRYSPRRLMVWAVLLYLLRFGLILYYQDPLVVTLSSILQGIAFGLMLTSLKKHIFDIAPRNLQTSALTISDAVFLSLTVIIGGTVGGWIIQQYSVMTLMAFCMGSTFLSLLLLLARLLYSKKTP